MTRKPQNANTLEEEIFLLIKTHFNFGLDSIVIKLEVTITVHMTMRLTAGP